MNVRLMLTVAVAICGLSASQAHAGSPYYSNDAAVSAGDDSAGVSEGAVAAPASPMTRRATAAPAATSPLGADGYLPIQQTPSMYNHAMGTMGSP